MTENSLDISHPTPEALESYARASVRDRLDPNHPDVIRIEEHLLWCHPCLGSVEEEEATVLLIKDGLESMKSHSRKPGKPKVLHAGHSSF